MSVEALSGALGRVRLIEAPKRKKPNVDPKQPGIKSFFSNAVKAPFDGAVGKANVVDAEEKLERDTQTALEQSLNEATPSSAEDPDEDPEEEAEEEADEQVGAASSGVHTRFTYSDEESEAGDPVDESPQEKGAAKLVMCTYTDGCVCDNCDPPADSTSDDEE